MMSEVCSEVMIISIFVHYLKHNRNEYIEIMEEIGV